MTQYSYTPLDGNDSVRILELDPDEDEEAFLCGSLEVISLSSPDSPPFETLSYAWGDPSKTAVLATPDGDIPITRSLESALRHLREKDGYLRLWVDAICINQDDHKEKSAQVRLMAKIYSLASGGMVYLGPEADNSLRAMQLLEYLWKLDLDKDIGTGSHRKRWLDNRRMSMVPPFADEGWPALRALLRRPWFRRLWVVQEFVLGKNVCFMCGSEWRCSWKRLWDPLEALMRYNIPGLLGKADDDFETRRATRLGWDCFKRMVTIRQAFEKGEPFPLHALMLTSRRAQASDPRDHLFGMLGLADNMQYDKAFDPDYDEDLLSVVIRYAVRFVQFGRIDSLLRDAGAGPHCAEFPSWIPDWAYANPLKPIPINWTDGFERRKNLYCAGGTSPSRAGFAEDGFGKDNVFVNGSPVDIIAKLGSPYHEDPLHSSDIYGYRSMDICLQSAQSQINSTSTYPTEEDPEEVLWRTLIADKTKDNHRAPKDEMERSFHAFTKYIAHQIAQNFEPITEGERAEEYDRLCDEAELYSAEFGVRMKHRKPCLTERGYFGIVPEDAEVGDVIAVFIGVPLPFVLRRSHGSEDAFRMVGHCYIHGMVQGEALEFEGFDARLLRLH